MMANQATASAVTPRKRRAKSTQTSPEILLKTIIDSLEDAKAEEIVSIPLAGKSSIADYMVVATGRSTRHVSAVSERVVSDMRDAGWGKAKTEGQDQCDWVLIDAGDVIIHVFRPEVRDFYNLEKMWTAETPPQTAA
ncbi:MAG: ribosome silencing factor [Rhizobiales bacterium]|nr:ribosome silencing factor [Hyphomicrobiales bacterium]